MARALRKLVGVLDRSRTALLFTNQLREKIGVPFGSAETTPGGRALEFYASVHLEIRRCETLKEGGFAVGIRARVRVVKNKLAPPFGTAEFDILHGQGISKEGDLLDLSLASGVLGRAGAFLSFGELRLGQGRENARAFLRENSAVRPSDYRTRPPFSSSVVPGTGMVNC